MPHYPYIASAISPGVNSVARSKGRSLSATMSPVISAPQLSRGQTTSMTREEGGSYYDMHRGEFLHGHYTVVRKLGWGQYSSA